MHWIEERVSEYRDFLSYVLLYSPDEFPEEDYLESSDQMNLDKAFAELRRAFPMIKKRVKEEETLAMLRELLEISYEAYKSGEDKKGAYALQEYTGIIWPKYKMKAQYENEARQRAQSNSA
jgi:hypothetical protein